MKTFVLIHGSWHSAWNWHRVMPILKSLGHQVHALDLPGMGRDKTPISEVKMEKTVSLLAAFIKSIEGKVILVGHSKNGIMISQLAEILPDKIEKLIYLAAYLIPHGKTQREYSIMDTAGWLKPYVQIHSDSSSSTLHPHIYKEGLYHDTDDSIVEMAKLILGPEPLESGMNPLHLSATGFGSLPRYYIECLQDRAVTPFIQKKMYQEIGITGLYSMNASHSPFFSKPAELVNIFQEIAYIAT